MTSLPKPVVLTAILLTLAAPLGALAANNDAAVVYGDALSPKGELGMEVYAEIARLRARNGQPERNGLHSLAELSYGLGEHWDAALKLPVTREDGHWHADGIFAEIKYIAPHAVQGWYYGAEVEAGRVGKRGEERAWALELVPIVGYRAGQWHATANPGLEYETGDDERGVAFQPKMKLAYQYTSQHAFGIEYHVDAGLLSEHAPRSQRNEMAYLSWDTRVGKHQVSAGIGRGMTPVSQRWAFKVNVELDD